MTGPEGRRDALRDGVRLADRPWPDVGRPLVLVPLGSTEQHGPHLPLDTDTTIASIVCDALVARLIADDVDAVVAPAIAYGASGEHEGFPGTISIGTAALTTLLVEYGRSASAWAGRIVFVNGHGGNVEALTQAVPLLVHEGRDAAWLPCAPDPALLERDVRVDAHAGRTETSMLLAAVPDRVRADRIEPGNDAPLRELMPGLRSGGTRQVSANGVLGDPRDAAADEGRLLIDAIVGGTWARLCSGRADARGCLVPDGPDVADGLVPDGHAAADRLAETGDDQ